MTQITVLSLGGGMQSTCMYLLSRDGKLPKYDYVIFADTGSEQDHTLDTVSWIQEDLEDSMDTDFITVRKEGLPLYQQYMEDGRVPKVSDPRCTDKWKIRPIQKFIRSVVDEHLPKPWAEMHLGITCDEAHRQRESHVQYLENKFPLIELGWTRNHCKAYLSTEYPQLNVKKSGCWHCHYQPKSEWAKLRRNDPEKFAIALEMEQRAKANGVRMYGLWGGKTIEGFDNTHTLEDFGFDLGPGDFDCKTEGSCFL